MWHHMIVPSCSPYNSNISLPHTTETICVNIIIMLKTQKQENKQTRTPHSVLQFITHLIIIYLIILQKPKQKKVVFFFTLKLDVFITKKKNSRYRDICEGNFLSSSHCQKSRNSLLLNTVMFSLAV